MARALPVEMNLWKIQNICYDLLRTTYADLQKGEEQKGEEEKSEAPKGAEASPSTRPSLDLFHALVEKLSLHVTS